MREFVFFLLVLVALGALFLAAWGLWPLLLYAAVVSLVPLALGVGVLATIAVLHFIADVVWPRQGRAGARCGIAHAGGRDEPAHPAEQRP